MLRFVTLLIPTGLSVNTTGQRPNMRQKIICLLLTALIALTTACQSHTATVTEQWLPLYLQLQLDTGKAQVQLSDSSGTATMENEARTIIIEETIQITADATEGAKFRLGDGSTLELMPGATLKMQNPHTLPRLQMTLQEGSLLLIAQKPSYEIIVPACSATILSLPAHIRVQVKGETTRLAVEEGALVCTLGTKTLVLPKCQEMYAELGKEPETIEFCDADATTTVIAMTPSPTFNFREPDTTPTITITPTSTPTPTRKVVIQTPTPTPPTDTPTPPPPPPPPPPPTQPPPTQPPPTQPPPTQPPPTNTPQPPTATSRATPTQPPTTKPPPTAPPTVPTLES